MRNQPVGKDKDKEDNKASGIGETSENILNSNDDDDYNFHEVPGTPPILITTSMMTVTKRLLPILDV